MLGALDRGLLRLLRTRGHAAPVERAALALTRLGEHGALWLGIAAGGALADSDRRSLYRRAAKAVIVAYGTNQAIKFTVRRPRPVLDDLPPLAPTVSRLSYPSAHASTSFAAARVLGGPFYALAAAVAVSRPYAGVHYPSDSLAGVALGLALGSARR